MATPSEGDRTTVDTWDSGKSDVLTIKKEWSDYLGYDPARDLLVIKFDKGKHGRFLGIGVLKDAKANQRTEQKKDSQ